MAVKNRNVWFVIIVSIITCFIYAIYWFYQTRKELYGITKKEGNALVDTILLFIPLVNIWIWYKYADDVEAASKAAQNKWIVFLLFMVFFPAGQFLVQNELNAHADA